jgi:transposase-like protein
MRKLHLQVEAPNMVNCSLLSSNRKQRDEAAALRFLKARRPHGVPEKIPMAGSEANAAARRHYNVSN